jgi:thioredoxin 1
MFPHMKGNLIGGVFILALVGAIAAVVWNGVNARESAAAGGSGDLVLMDFYADWCGPCRQMKPVVNELRSELAGQLTVMEVNVDSNPDLARQYNVRSIPCFVVTKAGTEVARRVGGMSKESLRELAGL